MESDKYQYSPLSDLRQIRLLRLHPRDDSEDTQLSVDLITVPLDEAPPFEALSYAWGDLLPQAGIRCSGHTAKIGLSLHGALRQLAPRTPEPDRLIWADALCINQEDMPERNAQVRIMGDVYATASKTLIWLGEEDDGVARAMGWLEHFLEVAETFDCAEGSTNSWGDLQTMFRSGSPTATQSVQSVLQRAFGGSTTESEVYEDIWVLLCRPWFTRKWVIQEVAKSMRHETVLVAGSKHVRWMAFKALFLVLITSPATFTWFLSCCRSAVDTPVCGASGARSAMLRAKALSLSLDEDAPLLFQVALTLDFMCTDPRDHIFALVGISKNESAYESLIDYDSSIAVLSRRLAQASLNDPRDLQALWALGSVMSAERRQSVYSVSWMPNLESLPAMHSASTQLCALSYEASNIVNASEGTLLSTSMSGQQLHVTGRIADRLESVGMDASEWFEAAWGSPNNTVAGILEAEIAINSWLTDCQLISEVAKKDQKTFLDALFLPILEIAPLPEEALTPLAIKAFPEYRKFQKELLSSVDETGAEEIIITFFQTGNANVGLLAALLFRMMYRRFSSTVRGKMGWAPRAAEAGDLICVFDGMAVPYAVRPKREAEGVYELVGECFISGLMAGEAMETVGVQPTVIKLE